MLRTLQFLVIWTRAFWYRFLTPYVKPSKKVKKFESIDSEELESLAGVILRAFAKAYKEAADVYGGDGILGEDDFNPGEIFKLFKSPERMLEQFISWNKKTYKQTYRTEAAGYSREDSYKDAMAFINAYHRGLGSPKVHGEGIVIKQWVYIFGIPVLVVNSLPWDDPGDEVWELGNFFNEYGIVTVEHDDVLETIEHEIVHAMVAWLKSGKVYAIDREVTTLQALFARSDSMLQRALARFRNECIAYMVANPGRLANREEGLLVRSLTGRDKETLANHMNQQDYDLITGLCRIAQGVDDNRHPLGRIVFCQIIMKYAELNILTEALLKKTEELKSKK